MKTFLVLFSLLQSYLLFSYFLLSICLPFSRYVNIMTFAANKRHWTLSIHIYISTYLHHRNSQTSTYSHLLLACCTLYVRTYIHILPIYMYINIYIYIYVFISVFLLPNLSFIDIDYDLWYIFDRSYSFHICCICNIIWLVFAKHNPLAKATTTYSYINMPTTLYSLFSVFSSLFPGKRWSPMLYG